MLLLSTKLAWKQYQQWYWIPKLCICLKAQVLFVIFSKKTTQHMEVSSECRPLHRKLSKKRKMALEPVPFWPCFYRAKLSKSCTIVDISRHFLPACSHLSASNEQSEKRNGVAKERWKNVNNIMAWKSKNSGREQKINAVQTDSYTCSQNDNTNWFLNLQSKCQNDF